MVLDLILDLVLNLVLVLDLVLDQDQVLVKDQHIVGENQQNWYKLWHEMNSY